MPKVYLNSRVAAMNLILGCRNPSAPNAASANCRNFNQHPFSPRKKRCSEMWSELKKSHIPYIRLKSERKAVGEFHAIRVLPAVSQLA